MKLVILTILAFIVIMIILFCAGSVLILRADMRKAKDREAKGRIE